MNKLTKPLIKNILPSLGGLFVIYLYNIVDGIFVGQGVGSSALGAVNVAVPFITFVVALTSLFGMGGATIVAIRKGRGDTEGANNAFMTALMLSFLASLILMGIGVIFSKQIIDLSGGKSLSKELRVMASKYLLYYSLFSIPMLMGNTLCVFVRNDDSPVLSFSAMLAGAITNIFLDWLFIYPLKLGVIGAAIASGVGQILTVLILLMHFIAKKGTLKIKKFKLNPSLVIKICKRGIPEAITELSTPVTALCYNIMLAKLVGDLGVSTFSILSFIYSLANAILSGVAQGIQPLWGRSFGEGEANDMKWYFKRGIIINLTLGLLIYLCLFIFDIQVITIFNKEQELVSSASKALPYFSLSFIPMAVNLILTAYFFSTKRTTIASIIALCRGIVIKAILIFSFPLIFNISLIWLAPFVTELITLFIGILLNKKIN